MRLVRSAESRLGLILGFKGKLIDRDYRYMARKCGREVNLRSGDDITTFPIEKARLRSIWYLILVSITATLGYGWALHVKTVRFSDAKR